jgi:hypothetical protein
VREDLLVMTTTSLPSVTHPVHVTFGDAFVQHRFSLSATPISGSVTFDPVTAWPMTRDGHTEIYEPRGIRWSREIQGGGNTMSDTTTSKSHGNKGSGPDRQPDSVGANGAGEIEIIRWECDDDDDSSVIRGID